MMGCDFGFGEFFDLVRKVGMESRSCCSFSISSENWGACNEAEGFVGQFQFWTMWTFMAPVVLSKAVLKAGAICSRL